MMAKRSRRFKAGVSAIALIVAVFGAFGFRKLQALAADAVGEKDCRATASGEQERLDLDRIKAVALSDFFSVGYSPRRRAGEQGL